MIRRHLVNLVKHNIRLQQLQRAKFASQSDKQSKSQKTSPDSQSNKQSQQENAENQNKEEEYKPENEDRSTLGWKIWRTFFWGSMSIFSYNCYLVATETKDTPAQKQFGAVPGFITAAQAAYQSYQNIMGFWTEPPVKKLLADPLHPLIQPKTLVLNLSGTLIDTEFIIGKGMTLKRRPGLNQFLSKLSQLYEVIIFTDDDYIFLTSVIPILDPRQQIFMGFFGRECMVWHKGHAIKDLKYLNRDLKSIIVIDKNINNVIKHPLNTIVLKEFHGQQTDNELIKLLPLLESNGEYILDLSSPEIRDVRKVLQKMGQNPHEKFYEAIKEKQQKIKAKQSSGFFGLFSGKKKQ